MSNMNPEFKVREVAERIRLTRESVGFTPEEMAEKCGVSTYEYLAYEGAAKDFSFTFIYKFANACGVEITELMEITFEGLDTSKRLFMPDTMLDGQGQILVTPMDDLIDRAQGKKGE